MSWSVTALFVAQTSWRLAEDVSTTLNEDLEPLSVCTSVRGMARDKDHIAWDASIPDVFISVGENSTPRANVVAGTSQLYCRRSIGGCGIRFSQCTIAIVVSNYWRYMMCFFRLISH